MSKINLKGLFSTEIINDFLINFNKLTGLVTSVLDKNGQIIIPAQENSQFCQEISKLSNGLKCRNSDIEHCKIASQLHKPYVYKCYSGLIDVVIPLYYNNEFLGAIITGQVLIKGYKRPNLKKNLNIKNKFLLKKLEKLLKKVPVLSRETIENSAYLIFSVINYIIEIELRFLKENEITIEEEEENSKKIEEIKNYIKQNLKENLKLIELAKKVNLSPYYFSRLFKKVTNKNFHEFINNERIEEAKKLLKNTNYPISTIAYDLGFNDSNYFSVVFKKFTGKTPKEYRNTLIKVK